MRKDILVLHTDAQMSQWIGALGTTPVQTPHLDTLAKEGSLFTNAYCCSAVCVPSRACVMTGRYPTATGVVSNNTPLPPSERTLGGILQEAGYKTGYFGKTHYGRSHPEVSSEFHEYFGVKEYNAYLGENAIGSQYPEKSIPHNKTRYWQIGASQIPEEHYFEKVVTDRAIRFLNQPSDAPMLAFVSFIAPHCPFTPPGDWAEMYDAASLALAPRAPDELDHKPEAFVRWVKQNREYLNEEECRQFLAVQYALISFLDAQVGRLLAHLRSSDRLKNTMILFTSDHGDYGTGYGILGKSWNLIEPLVRIPLIVSGPGFQKDVIRDELIENIDILPTILEFAGLPIPLSVQGRSFLPLLRGEDYRRKSECFAFNAYENSRTRLHQSSVRRGPWRLIVSSEGPDQLYQVEEDPWNWHNVADRPEHHVLVNELRTELLMHHVRSPGLSFERETAGFWEDETCFYDKARFTGERIQKRGKEGSI